MTGEDETGPFMREEVTAVSPRIDQLFAELDRAQRESRERIDTAERKARELRRRLRRRKVDSEPKLLAVLSSRPPPIAAEG